MFSNWSKDEINEHRSFLFLYILSLNIPDDVERTDKERVCTYWTYISSSLKTIKKRIVISFPSIKIFRIITILREYKWWIIDGLIESFKLIIIYEFLFPFLKERVIGSLKSLKFVCLSKPIRFHPAMVWPRKVILGRGFDHIGLLDIAVSTNSISTLSTNRISTLRGEVVLSQSDFFEL